MSIPSQDSRIVFTGKEKVALEPFKPGEPGPGQLRLRTRFSLMSTGTENIVFNRLFDPDTHWDRWVRYPFLPGYSSVGVVEAVGADVTGWSVGQRVAYRMPHASRAIERAENCIPLPEGLSFEEAAWFALGKITFHGALAADYRLGDYVLIIGAGPIGQMSIRWAHASGAARIAVVDPAAHRMPLAKAGSATALITKPIDAAREEVLAAGEGRPPRVIIDSTGNAAVFSAALQLVADRGKVVILGDTGRPASQTLTPDVILRGLTIVGAHDGHNTDQWNNVTIGRLFFQLAASGRFSLAHLTSHTFAPEECGEAYAVANRDRFSTMGILFDWDAKKRHAA